MRLITIIFFYGLINFSELKWNAKFRIEKINFVWNKAVSLLTDEKSRLEKLQRDLDVFDSLYLTTKQDQHHEKTVLKKGIEEIDRKLEALLQRYDLEDAIHAFRMKYKYDKEKIYASSQNHKPTHSKDQIFEDFRLQSIWDSIKENNALTLSELDGLYYDLVEHEQKLDEYNQLLDEVTHHGEQNNKIIVEEDSPDKNELLKTLKHMNTKLETNLKEIELRVSQILTNPFKNEKVRRLWEKAIRIGNLIPNELDAIKSELRHFENHLEKASYHEKNLKELEEFGNDKDNVSSELRVYHEKLLRKIKKLKHYLNEKISVTEHTEL